MSRFKRSELKHIKDALHKQLTEEIENQGLAAVLVVSPAIRSWLAKLIRHRLSDLTVLSYSEIPDDQSVNVVATIDVDTTAES